MASIIRYIILVLACALLSGCGFSRIQKSTDNDYKFAKAKEFYEKEKWMNCALLCESVLQPYRGTEKGEDALYYTYMSYINNEDYPIARTYIKSYIKSYPRGRYIENAKFNLAYCYYNESPDVKLDQEPTVAAIEEFEEYLEYYKDSENAGLAKEMLIEMREKLALKELNTVKLYYNLGDYQGNNYMSAAIAARNAKRKYPQSRYCEDYAYYIFLSAYSQADLSVASKQLDRYIDASDEYFAFTKEFPESKYKKDADAKYVKIKKFIDKNISKKVEEN